MRLGSAALSGMIIRLVIQPATARPTSTTADIHQCSWPSSPVTSGDESQLPSTVPTVTAMTVVSPRTPLADGDLVGAEHLGNAAELGRAEQRGLRADQRDDEEHQIDVADARSPATANDMMTISAILQATITSRLLKRSAR